MNLRLWFWIFRWSLGGFDEEFAWSISLGAMGLFFLELFSGGFLRGSFLVDFLLGFSFGNPVFLRFAVFFIVIPYHLPRGDPQDVYGSNFCFSTQWLNVLYLTYHPSSLPTSSVCYTNGKAPRHRGSWQRGSSPSDSLVPPSTDESCPLQSSVPIDSNTFICGVGGNM